ncbi:hypothetical protein [Mycoplasma suis]|nr:hypothetical protein [Mycoplasma suis]
MLNEKQNLFKNKNPEFFYAGGAFVQHSSNNNQLVGEIKTGGNSG